MIEIIGFDPGGTTGWAWTSFNEIPLLNRGDVYAGMEWDCGQFYGDECAQSKQMYDLVREFPRAIVVVEGFRLRRMGIELSPVRVAARFEMLVWMHERRKNTDRWRIPVYEQMPSMAKSTMTDERLSELGLWAKGKPHGRDALRHCLTFARRMQTSRNLLYDAFPYLKGS